jgi:Ser/Thr protein kinase RdoA (MazF antagonist)
MQSDEILIEAARLLRRFHDMTEKFVIPPNAIVHHAAVPMLHEVICHNDFAPYNCVFDNQHLAGMIDFDVASPGTRLWDVVYAVYRFVPLTNDAHSIACGWQPIPDRIARLKLFCDTYGLDGREALIETVIQRLEALVAYMRSTSSNLEHIPLYLADLDYIRQHQQAFTDAITA